MLRIMLVLLVFSVFFYSSCDYIPVKKRLLVYTQITATNDTLDKLTREWHQLLYMSTRDKNFTRLQPSRIKIGQFLSRNRAIIANMQVRQDSQNLIDSEEVYLSNQATVVSDVYTPFEEYNEMTPNDNINGQLKLVANDLNNVVSGKNAISQSLQAYLTRNKMQVKK